MKSGLKVPVALAAVGTLAVMLGGGLVLLSDQSPAWPVLFIMALALVGSMFWSRDLTQACFAGFLFALPIDISKSLIKPDVVYYWPGLWLSASDLFLFGFLALWFFGRKLMLHESRVPIAILPYALLYLGYLWFSALIAVSPGQGMLMALVHTKFLVAFIAVADYIRSQRVLRVALVALGAGLALQIAMIGAQVATRSYLPLPGINLADTGNLTFSGGITGFRPTGFLKHPIALADYLVFVLPPAIALLIVGRETLGRAWVPTLALVFGASVGLVATLSRGGWIAFFAAMAFLLVVLVSRSLLRFQVVAGMVVAAVLILSVTAIVYPPAYLRLVESDQRSSEARVLMISQSRLIGSKFPILGVGLGGYHRASKIYKPTSFASANEILRGAISSTLGVVHNKYLLVYAEHGLVGLGLLLVMLWKAVRVFFLVPAWNDRTQQLLGAGISAALFGQAVMYLFDHFYLEVGILMFWVFLGVLVALSRLQDAQEGAGGNPAPGDR